MVVWIVDVAFSFIFQHSSVKGLIVKVSVEFISVGQSLWKIRICDKESCKRYTITLAFLNFLKTDFRTCDLVIVQQAFKERSKSFSKILDLFFTWNIMLRCFWLINLNWFHELNKSNVALVQLLKNVRIGFNWVLIKHVIIPTHWWELNANLIGFKVF